jgi:predicted helicase
MRQHLMQTFDKIYILDLHGNSLKKETSPDGSPDINVFDIQAGVSIILGVKTKQGKNNNCEILHKDLYGSKQSKYDFLLENSRNTTDWKKLEPSTPYYFFVEKNFESQEEYDKGVKLSELFTINTTGIITTGDSFMIGSKNGIKNNILDFLENDYSESQLKNKYNLGKNYGKWILENKKKVNFDESLLTKICYRPFDDKFTYFDRKLVWRLRENAMLNMLNGNNLGLSLCKQFKSGEIYEHVFISNSIIESSFVSNRTSEITSLFPLYIYPQNSESFIDAEQKNRPNFNPEIIKQIEEKLGMKLDWEASIRVSLHPGKKALNEGLDIHQFTPTDLLDYIYAVLHSLSYREKYKEFLKIDFPRIPFDVDKERFWNLVKIGEELRKLHLMEGLNDLEISSKFGYPETGDNLVEKPLFKDNKVYINAFQYFAGVKDSIWNFYIWGYQPAQKWLKDRKGRELSFDDIIHYQKILYVLGETEKLMGEIK